MNNIENRTSQCSTHELHHDTFGREMGLDRHDHQKWT
jgi:hypothetical protein